MRSVRNHDAFEREARRRLDAQIEFAKTHPDLRGLRHLKASVTNFTPFGRGNCFQRSVAMVMDVPTAKLIVGTLTTDHSYLHAWVEDRGRYFDPSRFEEDRGLRAYDKTRYEATEGATDIHVLNRKQVMNFARRGALSRWMLTTDNTYHTLGGIMGHVLLDEMGVSFRVDGNGFLFPA